MGSDLTFDCGKGIVLGMSLDKDEFGPTSHLRRPFKNSSYVSRFVTCRNNYRNKRFLCALRDGAYDYEVGKGQFAEWPEANQKAICNAAERQGPKNFL